MIQTDFDISAFKLGLVLVAIKMHLIKIVN